MVTRRTAFADGPELTVLRAVADRAEETRSRTERRFAFGVGVAVRDRPLAVVTGGHGRQAESLPAGAVYRAAQAM